MLFRSAVDAGEYPSLSLTAYADACVAEPYVPPHRTRRRLGQRAQRVHVRCDFSVLAADLTGSSGNQDEAPTSALPARSPAPSEGGGGEAADEARRLRASCECPFDLCSFGEVWEDSARDRGRWVWRRPREQLCAGERRADFTSLSLQPPTPTSTTLHLVSALETAKRARRRRSRCRRD